MSPTGLLLSVLVVLLFLGECVSLSFVSNVIGSSMVLQRAPQQAKLWGWSASAGNTITVDFNGGKYTTQSQVNGAWSILLPATAAGGPYTIKITSNVGETATLNDILFGDVFVCSGQSNMVSYTGNWSADPWFPGYMNIRLQFIRQDNANQPLPEFKSGSGWWTTPPSILEWYSAVCWHFARNLYDKIQVPIGLTVAARPGSPIQAWSSTSALAACNVPPTSPGTLAYHYPSVLYNAVLAPLLPMSIKGIAWYQGESNAGQADYYVCAIQSLIRDWRSKFSGQPGGTVPNFMAIQLAPYVDSYYTNNDIASVRMAQSCALATGNANVITAIDLGDPNGDIHPANKKPIGYRLSLAAQASIYNQPVVFSGPRATCWRVESPAPNAVVRVRFDPQTLGGGLTARYARCPNVPAQFCAEYEIGTSAGWVAATGTISGDTITVSATVANDVTITGVRYLWGQYPVATLYNSNDLPAYPFAFPYTISCGAMTGNGVCPGGAGTTSVSPTPTTSDSSIPSPDVSPQSPSNGGDKLTNDASQSVNPAVIVVPIVIVLVLGGVGAVLFFHFRKQRDFV